eukprot:3668651-Rhodomonas_salina.2
MSYHPTISLQTCFAIPSTDIPYGPTPHHASYAIAGTAIAYQPTRFSVLTWYPALAATGGARK